MIRSLRISWPSRLQLWFNDRVVVAVPQPPRQCRQTQQQCRSKGAEEAPRSKRDRCARSAHAHLSAQLAVGSLRTTYSPQHRDPGRGQPNSGSLTPSSVAPPNDQREANPRKDTPSNQMITHGVNCNEMICGGLPTVIYSYVTLTSRSETVHNR